MVSACADATPFSPGANDNASGVAVVLELARRLARDRLRQTEVWLAFTDGEEVGAQEWPPSSRPMPRPWALMPST